jgi:hypothetical protein
MNQNEFLKLAHDVRVAAGMKHGITLHTSRAVRFVGTEMSLDPEHDQPHWELLITQLPPQLTLDPEVGAGPSDAAGDEIALGVRFFYIHREPEFEQMRSIHADARLTDLSPDTVNRTVDKLIADVQSRIPASQVARRMIGFRFTTAE